MVGTQPMLSELDTEVIGTLRVHLCREISEGRRMYRNSTFREGNYR